ncbi:ATP/GTP-binding protein [Corynebacterium hylobatis]|uniref:ATP/GTP-binding protein n=1 Tax=Corynebacterium hylobatis TaxID=1859290 RepID=A0A430I2G6_9CORY|nr:ATP/GTP-binding protein [Corynebacterium hylobatis]RSZ66083.1 ATP/GTP-binding protein [Corynebacterium hylobatis]
MDHNRIQEQHIAVFGESGSGKTVLVSTFYGLSQEPEDDQLFWIIADNQKHGMRLHQNYLGMRDSRQTPEVNRFASHSYAFSVRMKAEPEAKEKKKLPFDALRLVWHDYPGEWFEQDVSGEEAKRRVTTFRNLLTSDAALFLVDGQKLLDNKGQEERYLKALFTNFRNGLLSLKDDLLEDGKPLEEFPRIWVLALSKADLWPEMDVIRFRDLVTNKAGGEILDLRDVLAEFVAGEQALSVGEDFMLLSAAEFGEDKIEMKKNIGLDLILPLAAILPFQRQVRWNRAKLLPAKIAENVLRGGGYGIALVVTAFQLKGVGIGKLAIMKSLLDRILSKETIDDWTALAVDKLNAIHEEAIAQKNYLTASLTNFSLALDKAEENRILLRTRR